MSTWRSYLEPRRFRRHSTSRPLNPTSSPLSSSSVFRQVKSLSGDGSFAATSSRIGSIREDELEGSSFFYGGDVIDEDIVDDDEDAESSIDLFFRFLQSMFKKLSKRAKKASRTMLPVAISPQLLSFAVDGVLLLASLSIVKALLEVVCTLGGTVFVVILLLRVVWATISYFQSSGNNFNPGGTSYSSA